MPSYEEGARFVLQLPPQPPDYQERRRKARRKEDRFAEARSQAMAARELRARSTATVLADIAKPELSAAGC